MMFGFVREDDLNVLIDRIKALEDENKKKDIEVDEMREHIAALQKYIYNLGGDVQTLKADVDRPQNVV